ncbi:MAG TPA: carboxypeptidase-like regulatory domain-containing protein [Pyrinomonadaceae bacterium]|jgi:hypothetical protein|nr:carboxypeptidase-like regulatory domain-containing protein [Pyrinomonadaceae bacterium]
MSVSFLCVLSSTHSQSSLNVTVSITDLGDGFIRDAFIIRDARVTLYSLDRILQATVDSEGHYRFDQVPAGVYELEVARGGYKTVTRNLNVADQPADQPIFLKIQMRIANADCYNGDSVFYDPPSATAGATVNGTVVEIKNDRSKALITNAQVALFSADVKVSEQQTDQRGAFDFKSVAPGRYLIVVTHPRYRELRSSVFWVARENRTRITLEPIPADKIRVCE